MEILENVWTYLNPFVVAFLTYFIAIKNKKKDIDIKKTKDINIVLSNLLDVWEYLKKLEKFSDLKKVDLPIPLRLIPRILLSSKSFNDNSFKELENSIKLLKGYDPITYSELSGIGHRFDEIKNYFILPFLKAKNQGDLNKKMSEKHIKETIKEIEKHLVLITENLNYKISREIKKKISNHSETDIEDIKKEIIQNYYNLMMTIVPKNQKTTLKEFEEELFNQETKQILEKQLDVFAHGDFRQIIDILAENPYISIENMKAKLELKDCDKKHLTAITTN